MKRLNRKGFTLIELLAVIVVLAIVLVVTIPSVLRSVNNAREKSLENAANSIADWLTRQSELAAMADTGITDDEVDGSYTWLIDDYKDQLINSFVVLGIDVEGAEDLLTAAGFSGGFDDLEVIAIWYNGSKYCVQLVPEEATDSKSRFKGVDSISSTGCNKVL